MKTPVILATAVLLSASFAHGMGKPNTEPKYTPDLVAVEVKGFDKAEVKTNVHFNQFETFLIEPPQITFDKRWRKDVRVEMSSHDERRIQSQYSKALTKALQKALLARTHLTEASTTTNTTLVITPNLTRFRLNGADLSGTGRTKHFVDYVGSARVHFILKNGSNQKVLANLSDHDMTRSYNGIMELKPTNRVENLHDFKKLYRRWGIKLTRFLNSTKSETGKKSSPATDTAN